jgi:hypothetical protein
MKTAPHKIKKFGAKNMKELQYPNGKKVMISYETPVVLFDGTDYFTCTEKYSPTTTRQINYYFREETKNGPYVAFNVKRIPARELHSKIEENMLSTYRTY